MEALAPSLLWERWEAESKLFCARLEDDHGERLTMADPNSDMVFTIRLRWYEEAEQRKPGVLRPDFADFSSHSFRGKSLVMVKDSVTEGGCFAQWIVFRPTNNDKNDLNASNGM
mgnify:CR=1 FL=1